jgi:hypothetical protein
MGDRICQAISISTDGLRKICAQYPDFPEVNAIMEWKIRHPEFGSQYALAKSNQADLLAEEIIEISDDASRDYIVDAEGNEKFNPEHVARSRLRVDSRKWIACKLLPKIYGDKVVSETKVTISHEDALKELDK